MSLSQLILNTLAETGKSQARLAKDSGIPATTLSGWVLGTRSPSPGERGAAQLHRLAAGLGLPVRTVFKAAGRWVPEVSGEAEEQLLLEMYRALPPGDRAVVEATLRALYLKHRNNGDTP